MTSTEKELRDALMALAVYTEGVLTGPIMSKFVTWPDNFPESHSVLLQAARALARVEASAQENELLQKTVL